MKIINSAIMLAKANSGIDQFGACRKKGKLGLHKKSIFLTANVRLFRFACQPVK